MIACDLCLTPMQVPEPAATTGEILGLIVCSQCAEDAAEARQFQLESAQ